MRAAFGVIVATAVGSGAALLPASPAQAACSVFSRHPCYPTVCSVFSRHPCNPTPCSVFRRAPCAPDTQYPIGQDLRLTIESVSSKTEPPKEGGEVATLGGDGSDGGDGPGEAHAKASERPDPTHKLDTILDMYGALRACWVPPPQEAARRGMQMSVRFSFKRTGEIIGTPRVTYTTPDAKPAVRDLYHDAITHALERCTPMPFSKGLGGAVAGRPINIRYVDNRTPQ